jgi:hypothetical protein
LASPRRADIVWSGEQPWLLELLGGLGLIECLAARPDFLICNLETRNV